MIPKSNGNLICRIIGVGKINDIFAGNGISEYVYTKDNFDGMSKTNEYLKKVSLWEWDDESMDSRVKKGEDIVFCNEMIKREFGSDSRTKIIKLTDKSIEIHKKICYW